MPKVTVKGKVKKFPYTKKGVVAAKKAAKKPGADLEVKPKVEAAAMATGNNFSVNRKPELQTMNRTKKVNTYGMRNLKKG